MKINIEFVKPYLKGTSEDDVSQRRQKCILEETLMYPRGDIEILQTLYNQTNTKAERKRERKRKRSNPFFFKFFKRKIFSLTTRFTFNHNKVSAAGNALLKRVFEKRDSFLVNNKNQDWEAEVIKQMRAKMAKAEPVCFSLFFNFGSGKIELKNGG